MVVGGRGTEEAPEQGRSPIGARTLDIPHEARERGGNEVEENAAGIAGRVRDEGEEGVPLTGRGGDIFADDSPDSRREREETIM
jgi:hypothetical protein